MNADTRVVVFCYQGDQHQVEQLLPFYRAHGCSITAMSPADSAVRIPGIDCQLSGRRAYIGQESIDRHRAHLGLCLEYPEKYFFLCDPDAFCLSPEFPARLYRDAENTVWSNECAEPRPHPSPYPKIAMQPPYFLTRESIQRLLDAPNIPAHDITPFLDWYWLASCYSAGIVHRPFTLLEHPSTSEPFVGGTCWEQLAYRIRHMGTTMMHPIKLPEQVELCRRAYEERDR